MEVKVGLREAESEEIDTAPDEIDTNRHAQWPVRQWKPLKGGDELCAHFAQEALRSPTPPAQQRGPFVE